MEKESFDQWVIVEIMGHQRLAGHATEEVIAGTAMLRVDVPAVGGNPAFTQYIGGNSIYRMTPVSEEIARAAADRMRVQPPMAYEIEHLRQPSLGFETPEDFNDSMDDVDDEEYEDERCDDLIHEGNDWPGG